MKVAITFPLMSAEQLSQLLTNLRRNGNDLDIDGYAMYATWTK